GPSLSVMSVFHASSPPSVYSFSLCYGHFRDLHSFPTRRSSDLRHRGAAPGWRSGSRPGNWQGCLHQNRIRLSCSCALSCGGGGRSEEHTSELQSRENLVCRLLLEKKKKKGGI